MILERHYDEEALIAMLEQGGEAVSRDAHLAGCASCSENLEAYQTISEVLGDKSVWNFSDNFAEGAERGAKAIRAFAETMESEDAEAKELVDELLKSPRQWWMTTIEADGRYHTAGVLRRLIEVSEAKIKSVPLDALDVASSAVALTRFLASEPLLQVFAAAYRQYAFSLFYTGDFGRALEAVETAESLLDRCGVAEYALARLNIVRSLIYSRQERYEDALELSRRAARVFESCGDIQRYVSARMAEAYLLVEAHNDRDALAVLSDLRGRFWSAVDADTRARLLNNIGCSERRLGRISEAFEPFQLSAELYAELHNEAEAARVRYNIALLLAAGGKQSLAKDRLREVMADFDRLGMTHSAVVTGLDLAEIALLENDFDEVQQLCRAAIRQFDAAGVAYSREALTALTFLREAAEQRRATQATVWHVKTYIRRLPDQPALLFAPAPLPPQ